MVAYVTAVEGSPAVAAILAIACCWRRWHGITAFAGVPSIPEVFNVGGLPPFAGNGIHGVVGVPDVAFVPAFARVLAIADVLAAASIPIPEFLLFLVSLHIVLYNEIFYCNY